jgi:signal transduction histidine kinase/ActR/RegA family two-component response regulator
MKILSTLSIRTKYAALITLLIAVISLFIYSYIPSKLKKSEFRAITDKARSISEMTAYSIGPAIVFDDRKGGEEALQSARQNKDLVYEVVVDEAGRIFAEYNRDEAEKVNYRQPCDHEEIRDGEMVYKTETPIVQNGRQLGRLYTGISLEAVILDVQRSQSTFALVSLIIFLVGMAATFGITTVMTGGLRHMVDTVERIAEGDLEQRAAVSSHDEVGNLANSFNLMVDKLETARKELEDINRTLEKRVEERTMALQNEIKEREKAEQNLLHAQRMETIGNLAGGVAHDFNNILGIILGYITMLQGEHVDRVEMANYLDIVNTATQRGAGLVKQLLTFARKTDVHLESVSVNDVVIEIHKLLLETFPKTITLTLEPAPRLPFINADHNQLHQAILNLCVNARDAMPGGGILSIRTASIGGPELRERFPEAVEAEYECIRIADNGTGMDEKIIDHIFEPFYTTKERGKGTGLGLSVVYGVVNHHRGFIDVQSKPGEGTTFSVYFPVPIQKLEDRRTNEPTVVTGGPEKILLVEDEDALLSLLKVVIESKGYQTLTAQDGEDAVSVFANHKEEIALVLSDMGLPRLGGFEAFMRMREIKPNLKVVFASGYLDPRLRSDMQKAGATDFIQKPYAPGEILKKMREVLDRRP